MQTYMNQLKVTKQVKVWALLRQGMNKVLTYV